MSEITVMGPVAPAVHGAPATATTLKLVCDTMVAAEFARKTWVTEEPPPAAGGKSPRRVTSVPIWPLDGLDELIDIARAE